MYTDEQARELWCPEKPAHWQSSTDASLSRCQASGCMMWRWSTDPELAAGYNQHREEAIAAGMADPGIRQAEGYCGLAGRP